MKISLLSLVACMTSMMLWAWGAPLLGKMTATALFSISAIFPAALSSGRSSIGVRIPERSNGTGFR